MQRRLAVARPVLARALARTLLVLALCAGFAAPAAAQGTAPLAMHSMLQLNSPRGFKAVLFAEAAKAGASEIRVDASLGALNNPYIQASMWQGLDDYMQLSQQYSLPVLLDFNASNDPSLETCQPGADPTRALCGVTDLSGYYDEIAAVVRYTRGVIDDFEVVNEPDGAWAFSGTPQQYAAMLATAYRAVHDNDPGGRVVLGGIMTPSDMSWLGEVFATPGYNAAHAFDIGNVHLRDTLANLPGDVIGWRRLFAFFGDADLPLWVTETGYPADPAYQYDPAYHGTDAVSGAAEQALYLAREVPTLLFAGAARIFVTERDDLTGQYASEGLLTGQVTDNDETDPNPIERPAYTVFTQLAAQYATVPPPAPLPPSPPAPAAAEPPSPAPPATAASSAAATTPVVAAPAATKPGATKATPTPAAAKKPASKTSGPKKPTPRKPVRKRRLGKEPATHKPQAHTRRHAVTHRLRRGAPARPTASRTISRAH